MIPALAHLDPISYRVWEITCTLMITDNVAARAALKNERGALIASLSDTPRFRRKDIEHEDSSTFSVDPATVPIG